jgi:hypothetical protein
MQALPAVNCALLQFVEFSPQGVHFVRVNATGAAVGDVPGAGKRPAKPTRYAGNRGLALPDPVAGREAPDSFLRFKCGHVHVLAGFLRHLVHLLLQCCEHGETANMEAA